MVEKRKSILPGGRLVGKGREGVGAGWHLGKVRKVVLAYPALPTSKSRAIVMIIHR